MEIPNSLPNTNYKSFLKFVEEEEGQVNLPNSESNFPKLIIESLNDPDPEAKTGELLSHISESDSGPETNTLSREFDRVDLAGLFEGDAVVFRNGINYNAEDDTKSLNLLVVTLEYNDAVEKTVDRMSTKLGEGKVAAIGYLAIQDVARYCKDLERGYVKEEEFFEIDYALRTLPAVLVGKTDLINYKGIDESVAEMQRRYKGILKESPMARAYCNTQLGSGMV